MTVNKTDNGIIIAAVKIGAALIEQNKHVSNWLHILQSTSNYPFDTWMRLIVLQVEMLLPLNYNVTLIEYS